VRPPFAQGILVAVLACYAVAATTFVLRVGPPLVVGVLAIGAVAAMFALQVGVVSRRTAPPAQRRAALAGQAVLATGSIVALDVPDVGLPGFVAGSALLVLPGRARWIGAAVVVALVVLAQALLVGTPVAVVYGLVATVNHGLVVFALTRLRDLVDALAAARADAEALAVAQERLRFAADLHDLLGYGL
jgi:signal transduction histidine kinase